MERHIHMPIFCFTDTNGARRKKVPVVRLEQGRARTRIGAGDVVCPCVFEIVGGLSGAARGEEQEIYALVAAYERRRFHQWTIALGSAQDSLWWTIWCVAIG